MWYSQRATETNWSILGRVLFHAAVTRDPLKNPFIRISTDTEPNWNDRILQCRGERNYLSLFFSTRGNATFIAKTRRSPSFLLQKHRIYLRILPPFHSTFVRAYRVAFLSSALLEFREFLSPFCLPVIFISSRSIYLRRLFFIFSWCSLIFSSLFFFCLIVLYYLLVFYPLRVTSILQFQDTHVFFSFFFFIDKSYRELSQNLFFFFFLVIIYFYCFLFL